MLKHGTWLVLPVFLCGLLCGDAPPPPAEYYGVGAYYTGTIGKKLPIQMSLKREGEKLSGSYYYERIGIPLTLSGRIDAKSGVAVLEEREPAGKLTGRLRVRLSKDGFDLTGRWFSPNGKRDFPISLRKVANDVSVEEKGLLYTAGSRYPVFLGDSPAIKTINATVRKIMDVKRADCAEPGDTDVFPGPLRAVYEGECSLRYVSPGLISILVEEYSYAGGAHGNTWFESRNWQIKEGRAIPVVLKNLFRPDSQYLVKLSDACIKDLRRQKAGCVMSGEVKSLAGKDLSVFCLTPNGITFVFGEYCVGPYAEGVFFVTILYKNLSSLIDPNGPLGDFVKG